MQKNHLDLPETDEEFTQWKLTWKGTEFHDAWVLTYGLDGFHRKRLKMWIHRCEFGRNSAVTRHPCGLDVDEIRIHDITVMFDLGE